MNLPAPALVILLVAAAAIVLVGGGFFAFVSTSRSSSKTVATYARFFYASFLKPHTGDGTSVGQQAALESFYKVQVGETLFRILRAV